MKLCIMAKTNRTDIPPMINAAKIKLHSGNVLTFDRNKTEYKYNNNYLEMNWEEIYLHEMNGKEVYGINFIEGVSLKDEIKAINYLDKNMCSCELEIEDDAPEDYEVILEDCFFY